LDLLYFVVFVSVLIFIHEAGHFAFAKIFGVKVLAFSVGFGPKLVKIRGRETEYCVGLLPFGGFVKMLEEGKSREAILPEDRLRTFESQKLWKRIVIVLAGPAMNVLFPVLLYTSVFYEDREFRSPVVGAVVPDKPADGKLMPEDRIVSIDGHAVASFPEVQELFATRSGKPVRVVVQRDGATLDVDMVPVEEIEELEPKELDMVERVGRVGISPSFSAPVIGVPRTDSPAYRAGLRTFDQIKSVNGRTIDRFVDLVHILTKSRGDTLTVTYMRPVKTEGGLFELAVMEMGVVTLTPLAREDVGTHIDDWPSRERDVLSRTGIETSDMYVAFVPEGSSEWLAGLRAGDRVVSLDGVPQRLFAGMKQRLIADAARPHELVWTREGERKSGTFQLRKEQWQDEVGQPYARYVFRTNHWAPKAKDETVPNEHRLAYALKKGSLETIAVVRFIGVGFVRVFQGRVSLATVSGPITLYDVAGQAGAKGTRYFVWAMAVTSVNLGLINLLPIPVLDGGHLVFFLLEGIRRRPLSLRTREIASLVGMSVLMLLMALAFKNDVTRKWDTIRAQVMELVT
jgi:regulator of sigma E protease